MVKPENRIAVDRRGSPSRRGFPTAPNIDPFTIAVGSESRIDFYAIQIAVNPWACPFTHSSEKM